MALKRVKVSVTDEDYQVARSKCTTENMGSWPRECIITTAIRRYIPTMRGCSNYTAHTTDMSIDINLPAKARKAITSFDAWGRVAPFSFYITVPEELLGV